MKGMKLVLAASTLISTFLAGMALAVASTHAAGMRFDQRVISREAGEGPRGFDNERPRNRQRGRAIEQFERVA